MDQIRFSGFPFLVGCLGEPAVICFFRGVFKGSLGPIFFGTVGLNKEAESKLGYGLLGILIRFQNHNQVNQ